MTTANLNLSILKELDNLTAAELRTLENAVIAARQDTVAAGFCEIAKILEENGGAMPVSTIASEVGLAPAQVWNCNNKGKRQGAGVYYFCKREKKTFICPDDGDSITITRRTPMVRLKNKK